MNLCTFPSAQLKYVGYKTFANMVLLNSGCESTTFLKLVCSQWKFTGMSSLYLCIFPENFRSII